MRLRLCKNTLAFNTTSRQIPNRVNQSHGDSSRRRNEQLDLPRSGIFGPGRRGDSSAAMILRLLEPDGSYFGRALRRSAARVSAGVEPKRFERLTPGLSKPAELGVAAARLRWALALPGSRRHGARDRDERWEDRRSGRWPGPASRALRPDPVPASPRSAAIESLRARRLLECQRPEVERRFLRGSCAESAIPDSRSDRIAGRPAGTALARAAGR